MSAGRVTGDARAGGESQTAERGSEVGGVVDALIIGGGPAGLSAALNLGRARASVVVVDADRPRNAATLNSHGFLTRDGVPPHELRRLARTELEAYPTVQVLSRMRVTAIAAAAGRDGARFFATVDGRRGPTAVAARSVIVATGLRETLPDIAGIRGFYGMSLFSCAACDAWEVRDSRLALIGETPDLAHRARLIARWSDDLTVFTNGTDAIDPASEAELAASGITVERRPITALEGDRGALTGVRLDGGDGGSEVVAVDAGFVRPTWHPALEPVAALEPELDGEGHLVTDRSGRTSVPGLYGAGDAASPGPQQLIVAAGQGARVAAVLVHDLIGVTTAH